MEKGVNVGAVNINTESVSYMVSPGFFLRNVHVWAGTTPTPEKKHSKKNTGLFSPGQYGNLDDVNDVITYELDITYEDVALYYIIHAEVCGPGFNQ